MKKKPTTYFEAGVDITAGDKLVSRIKNISAPTQKRGVIDSIGGFAGLLEVPAGYREPVLVSSTDGVGTKLKLALETKNLIFTTQNAQNRICGLARPWVGMEPKSIWHP